MVLSKRPQWGLNSACRLRKAETPKLNYNMGILRSQIIWMEPAGHKILIVFFGLNVATMALLGTLVELRSQLNRMIDPDSCVNHKYPSLPTLPRPKVPICSWLDQADNVVKCMLWCCLTNKSKKFILQPCCWGFIVPHTWLYCLVKSRPIVIHDD